MTPEKGTDFQGNSGKTKRVKYAFFKFSRGGFVNSQNEYILACPHEKPSQLISFRLKL